MTVVDTTPPHLTCPANKAVLRGSAWSFNPPTVADACCTNVLVVILNTVTNGACPQFITRTWAAFDCCSNSAVCSQTVAVTNAPLVTTCPANIITNIYGSSVGVSYHAPTVTGGALVACTPPSGGTFTLGVTPVSCTATNACGTNTCVFNVTVLGPQVSGQVVLERYAGPAHNGLGSRDVTFSVTDGATFTNRLTQRLSFTNGVANYTLPVPPGTIRVGAKTAWNLRTTLGVSLNNAVAVADFTGNTALRAGDINESNRVDLDDYYQLAAVWYRVNDASDIDGSGRVDMDDYALLSNHWQQSGDPE